MRVNGASDILPPSSATKPSAPRPAPVDTDDAASPPALPAPSRWVAGRGRRVALLLVFIWVLNAFDLAMTIMANSIGHFNELNPIAREMLRHPHAVTAFKASLVAFATVVMFMFRKRRIVELACWALTLVYVLLSFIWMIYIHHSDRSVIASIIAMG